MYYVVPTLASAICAKQSRFSKNILSMGMFVHVVILMIGYHRR